MATPNGMPFSAPGHPPHTCGEREERAPYETRRDPGAIRSLIPHGADRRRRRSPRWEEHAARQSGHRCGRAGIQRPRDVRPGLLAARRGVNAAERSDLDIPADPPNLQNALNVFVPGKIHTVAFGCAPPSLASSIVRCVRS